MHWFSVDVANRGIYTLQEIIFDRVVGIRDKASLSGLPATSRRPYGSYCQGGEKVKQFSSSKWTTNVIWNPDVAEEEDEEEEEQNEDDENEDGEDDEEDDE
ncbi:hypothetical protein G6F42_018233 [Rhizopus arrhizus]|nr:hypothetical protein G6F42_018233 [Rhizopus arrhizus]